MPFAVGDHAGGGVADLPKAGLGSRVGFVLVGGGEFGQNFGSALNQFFTGSVSVVEFYEQYGFGEWFGNDTLELVGVQAVDQFQ